MTAAPAVDVRRIPLTELHESKLNPRQHYDPAALRETALSLKASGQLTLGLCRPRKAGGYEIAAGHRRLRAAKLPEAGPLEALDFVVREMDDAVFVTVLNTENLQRRDLNALEEARGFQNMIKVAGHNVQSLADALGMDKTYVYDRLKLLSLTPALQADFLAGAFPLTHAIKLARLSPEEQRRAADPKRGGLYEGQDARLLGEAFDDAPRKPVSERELQGWIDTHIRLRADTADPMIFPAVAAGLAAAKAKKLKTVSITYDTFLQPEARHAKERTYGPKSWKRADGEMKSRTCEHAVMGVVEAGLGRGDAFLVCVAKGKCAQHWPEKPKAAGSSREAESQKARWEREARARAERDVQAERTRVLWKNALPAMLEAFAASLKKASVKPGSPLAKLLRKKLLRSAGGAALALVPPGRTAETLLRHLAFCAVLDGADNTYWLSQSMPALAKQLGVNIKPALDAASRGLKALEEKKADQAAAASKAAAKGAADATMKGGKPARAKKLAKKK